MSRFNYVKGPHMMKFKYMWRDQCMAEVTLHWDKTITLVNYTDDLMQRPFGSNLTPTTSDLEDFFLERCFPQDRDNCRQILRLIGLDFYCPGSLCHITLGRQWDDYN